MEQKERKEHFIKIAGLVEKAGSLYAEYLSDTTNSGILEDIILIEREGDEIQEALNRHYTSQRNIPYLSLDRAKLLSYLDEILDQILLAAKTLDAFGAQLPDNFATEGKTLSEQIIKITQYLHEAVITIYDDFGKASSLTDQIERVRDDGTRSAFDLEKSYFNSEESADDWKSYWAMSRIVRRSLGIINATKSAGEMLQLMSMKYL